MKQAAIDLSLARLLPDRVPAPWSWATHISFAFFAVQALRPRVFVELGTHAGTSFLAFCQAAQTLGDSSAKYFAVDTWEGDPHAGYYGPEVYETLNAYLAPRYGSFAVLLRKYFDDALADFADGSIDLLHIDGLHTYEAVKHDFETWLPKLSRRGVVLFHDTQVFDREFGVYRLWRELVESGYQGFEFLHGHGLGVLRVGDHLPASFDAFLQFAQRNVNSVRERFARLGMEVLANAELDERRARARVEGGTMRFAADELIHLAEELELSNCEVARKDVAVSEQAAAIRSIAQQLEAKEGSCLALSHQVAERDGQIVSLNQAVADRDGQIDRLKQAVVERDGQIDRLNHAVVERDGQIDRLNHAVVERDGQIDRLNHAVAERDGQIDRLNHAVAERDGQIDRLNQAVAERDGQIDRLKQAVAERDGQIDRLKQAVAERDAMLRAMRSSTCWRLTAPLRGSKEIAGGVFGQKWRRFLGTTVGAVKSELRRRGPIGFAVRLPHYLRHRHFFVRLLESRLPGVEQAPVKGPTAAAQTLRLHPELAGVCTPIDHSVSIIIPTLNAGREFNWLLRKLRGQKGLKALQVVIVDSGSTDGTVALAKAAGCKVVEIPQKEFSHSFARNTGAAHASGDYVLFMVQDAYPIGEYWAYGMLRYLLDHTEDRVAAASCSEYSRSDSDMMYDSLINTHYRFLGCLERDRIGEYTGNDHVSLRSSGQLSDVSCIISRELFERYRFRGDYAEDLDLGVRLVKDGYRVAMLASVKVVHSHNRSAHYFFKRAFADVIFLTDAFEDFPCAPAESTTGLVAGIVSTAAHLSQWLESFDDRDSSQVFHVELAGLVNSWQKELMQPKLSLGSRLGDVSLDRYVEGLRDLLLGPDLQLDRIAQQDFRQFVDMFLARLEHFNRFASGVYRGVYLEQDGFLRQQLRDVVRKAFAAAAGSSLGFLYMARNEESNPEQVLVARIRTELQAGI